MRAADRAAMAAMPIGGQPLQVRTLAAAARPATLSPQWQFAAAECAAQRGHRRRSSVPARGAGSGFSSVGSSSCPTNAAADARAWPPRTAAGSSHGVRADSAGASHSVHAVDLRRAGGTATISKSLPPPSRGKSHAATNGHCRAAAAESRRSRDRIPGLRVVDVMICTAWPICD